MHVVDCLCGLYSSVEFKVYSLWAVELSAVGSDLTNKDTIREIPERVKLNQYTVTQQRSFSCTVSPKYKGFLTEGGMF